MMNIAACIGCDTPFIAKRANQKRCRKGCGTKGGGNTAQAAKRELHELEFIGVDGEGISFDSYDDVWDSEEQDMVEVARHEHDYVLLSVGKESLHKNGERLTFRDIFPFLWSQYEANPHAVFVGFFLGYDFTHWFRNLPYSRAYSLLHKNGIARRKPREGSASPYPFAVRCEGWEFDILANKRFKLRPWIPKAERPSKVVNHKDGTASVKYLPRPWMYINDVGPFFQSSFLSAIKPKNWATPVCSQTEYETIERGKARRATAGFDPEMITYNILENEVLARMMTRVNEGFVVDNIRLKKDQWYGPGQAAQAWLTNISAPTGELIRDTVPKYARDAARESYYGGWFEIFAHGRIPGKAWAYDINSAYPYGISRLPCLLHGTWTHGTGKTLRPPPPGALRLIDATVSGSDSKVGPIPFRRPDGSILRPLNGRTWIWDDELDASRAAGLVDSVKVHKWIDYVSCSCACPLESIRELYQGRLDVGKNTSAGKGKKLVYNSSYGKMAQSVGMPKYSNSIYASRITSMCRTQILHAIATHPEKTKHLLMVATDSVVFRSPHPSIEINETKLGAWDETIHEELTLFMPGVYWSDKTRADIKRGDLPDIKSRGISAKDLGRVVQRLDNLFDDRRHKGIDMTDSKIDGWPSLTIPVDFQMTSAKQAVTRTAWDTCGAVSTSGYRAISSNPHLKRWGIRRATVNPDPHAARLGYDPGRFLESIPYTYASDDKGRKLLQSTPYDRAFGEDIRSMDNREDVPITPEGDIISLVQRVLIPR